MYASAHAFLVVNTILIKKTVEQFVKQMPYLSVLLGDVSLLLPPPLLFSAASLAVRAVWN